MPEFAIITPTIGRDTLRRCLITMRHQILTDYLQIVVGDGHQEPWVKEECAREERVHYFETAAKEGFYGTAPRNAALELLESGALGEFGYVLFVDDDNVLLEPSLYNLREQVVNHDRPPLLWYDVLFTNKYKKQYYVIPECRKPLVQGDWDGLNSVFRADVIRGLRWKPVYSHDYLFACEASERAGYQWVRCEGVGAVHHLSWDTYEQVRKT